MTFFYIFINFCKFTFIFFIFGATGLTFGAILDSPRILMASGGSILVGALMILASSLWWLLEAVLILFWKDKDFS